MQVEGDRFFVYPVQVPSATPLAAGDFGVGWGSAFGGTGDRVGHHSSAKASSRVNPKSCNTLLSNNMAIALPTFWI